MTSPETTTDVARWRTSVAVTETMGFHREFRAGRRDLLPDGEKPRK
jgi:hypothetical protein